MSSVSVFLGRAMMKILCLGSSGFVGRVLLDRFRQNNDWEVDGIGSSSLNLAKP